MLRLLSANTMRFHPITKWVRQRLFRFSSAREDVPNYNLKPLECILGYRFKKKELLVHALKHRSSLRNDKNGCGTDSNERLEFLGDAVLNCLITDYLYKTYPHLSEGALSKIKSLVVSRKILGEIAGQMEVGPFIIFGHSEQKSGGRERLSTLANTFEALLGALYLDGGLMRARRFLTRFLFSRVNEFWEDEENYNYKSAVLEMSQRDGFGIPRYRLLTESGPDHAKEFTVQIEIAGVPLGKGSGPNKKIAQQNAAQNAARTYTKELIVSHCKGVSDS